MAFLTRLLLVAAGALAAAAVASAGIPPGQGEPAPSRTLQRLAPNGPGAPAGSPNLQLSFPSTWLPGARPRVFVDTFTIPGRLLYRFDASIDNTGGVLSIYCLFCSTDIHVYQQVYASGIPSPVPAWGVPPSGGTQIPVGVVMMYDPGPGHGHWHVHEAARYELLLPGGGARVSPKVGFCMVDSRETGATRYYDRLSGNWCLSGLPASNVAHEGTSPGEGDFYPAQLIEQWVDVTGLVPGTYTLRGVANPTHAFVETTEADNVHTEPRVIPGPTAAAASVVVPPGEPVTITLAGGLVGADVLAYDGCGSLWQTNCYRDALDAGGAAEPLSFTVTDTPDHGTLTSPAAVDGTHASVVYAPDPGYTGPDAFAFTTGDSRGLSSLAATVTIEVGESPGASPPPAPTGPSSDTGGTTSTPKPGLVIRGTRRADGLVGSSRGDVIRGGPGDDTLIGLGGPDRLYGGDGADVLVGGRGRDLLFGGRGRDVLRARDGQTDVLSCGSGRDVAFVDHNDRADASCETVRHGSA